MIWYWLLILTAIFLFFTIGIKIANIIQSREIDLDFYNTLYQCETCGKLHRKYQQELKRRIDSKFAEDSMCPRCNGPVSIYTGEEYEWIKTSPESPRLTAKKLKHLKRAFKKLEKLGYEERSIDTFLHYYQLLPGTKEEDLTK